MHICDKKEKNPFNVHNKQNVYLSTFMNGILKCVEAIKTNYLTDICDWICKNQPGMHKNLNSFFLTQLIAILNSYPYTMSPVARLRWSAFLRGGFTAL